MQESKPEPDLKPLPEATRPEEPPPVTPAAERVVEELLETLDQAKTTRRKMKKP
ncbi:MAG: hypothetical protein ABI697_11145 [Devosia sp.]